MDPPGGRAPPTAPPTGPGRSRRGPCGPRSWGPPGYLGAQLWCSTTWERDVAVSTVWRHRKRPRPPPGSGDHGNPGTRAHRTRLAPQNRRGEPHRHHHRVVRLLPLRLRRRAGLQQAVLPQRGTPGRHAAVVPHLRGRLRRPPGRRPRLRPLRGPPRPQAAARAEPAAHGRGDLLHRPAADVRHDRGRRPGAAHHAPAGAGLRARRRVGRRGPAGVGARRREPSRLLGVVAADGRGRAASCSPPACCPR